MLGKSCNDLARHGGAAIVAAICLGGGIVASANAATEKVLYAFSGDSDGSAPQTALVNLRGTLYGTTLKGGAFGHGNVYTINRRTGAETVLYSFTGGGDGGCPGEGLTSVSGTLYGTTECGGAFGSGTVYSIDPATGAETVVHSFGNGSDDGVEPYADLINANGMLYGTTYSGGPSGHGTVFSIAPTTGAERVLYGFTGGSDGGAPRRAELIDIKGTLYGTTWLGGANAEGTVFSITPSGRERVLYSFCSKANCSDGAYPTAGLINVDGALYGTTSVGGTGSGTVFSVDRRTGVERVIYAFTGGSDGGFPAADLIDVNGTLYGTTGEGGMSGAGAVFSINPTTGVEMVLHAFTGGSDGSYPDGALINVKNTLLGTDTLYGTTTSGGGVNGCGGPGCGTIFAISP